MPPLVLALVDAVFGLAFHHDGRARALPDRAGVRVRAELRGPELDDPAPGGLAVRVIVSADEGEDETLGFHVDLVEERILALELQLAELPLDRSGLARLIGELEAWCYARIPIAEDPE